MKRIHLFEFEDFRWFPSFFRDGGTDFLGYILSITKFYAPAVKVIEDLVETTNNNQILDLCSGNGGPIAFADQNFNSKSEVRFILSDKYPNVPAYERLKIQTNYRVDYYVDSLDVTTTHIDLTGIRTMFSAIHHFRPVEVKMILRNIIDSNMPVCIFDGGDKHIGTILGIMIFHPVLFILFTPFIRPFKWSRIIFTYLIPIIPLYTIWDGIISILRLYQPEELLKLAKAADHADSYEWKSGKLKNSFGLSVAYLTGIPK